MCTLYQLPKIVLYPRLDCSLTARAAHEGCWEALLPAHSIPTLAGGEGQGGGPWCHDHRPVYHSRAELITRISRVIVAYRKQNKGNYYSSLVGGPWLISLRAAARRRGNLTVLIKHSAAAQSNYRESMGLCWGLSPSWGPGRAVPAEHVLPALTGTPLARQGGCSSSSPSAFSHVNVDVWFAKTFSRSKAFLGLWD